MTCKTCGHTKSQHIYEEGACRPGFVCACDKFLPPTPPDTALACLDETNKNMSHYASTTHMIVDLRTQLATQSQEIARLRERVGKLRAGLAGASKHCLCERFGPKGFDYGETHALLGRPKVGARWLTPPILIDAILAEDDRAAGEGGK